MHLSGEKGYLMVRILSPTQKIILMLTKYFIKFEFFFCLQIFQATWLLTHLVVYVKCNCNGSFLGICAFLLEIGLSLFFCYGWSHTIHLPWKIEFVNKLLAHWPMSSVHQWFRRPWFNPRSRHTKDFKNSTGYVLA